MLRQTVGILLGLREKTPEKGPKQQQQQTNKQTRRGKDHSKENWHYFTRGFCL